MTNWSQNTSAYQSLYHFYESSNASSLSNSSHHLNFIGGNFVGLDFVGLQNRKSNHRLIFQFTFWWETHFCFEKIIIIVIVVSARPSGWLTSRLRRSARKWEVIIFRYRHTLHHNIYIIIKDIIIKDIRPKPTYGRQGLAGRSLRASGAQLGSGKWSFFVTDKQTNTSS